MRYRYDKARCKRIKAVDLVVDVQDWHTETRIPANKLVLVRVGCDEIGLREGVKIAAGWWYPERKTWHLKYSDELNLEFEKRLVDNLGF